MRSGRPGRCDMDDFDVVSYLMGASASGKSSGGIILPYTDVSEYTDNEPFVAPSNGYLALLARGGGSYVTYRVLSSDGTATDNVFALSSLGSTALDGYFSNSVYVHKGMKIAFAAAAGTWLARFFPIQ